jgi:hypothetical protein
MSIERRADVVLRIGAAFAFLYPPLNALSDPDSWIGYFPSFVHGYVPDPLLLHTFGVVEVVIALWIFSGWRIFWPCIIATAMLVGIVAFNMPQLQILFRDLSIAAFTLGLGLLHLPRRSELTS